MRNGGSHFATNSTLKAVCQTQGLPRTHPLQGACGWFSHCAAATPPALGPVLPASRGPCSLRQQGAWPEGWAAALEQTEGSSPAGSITAAPQPDGLRMDHCGGARELSPAAENSGNQCLENAQVPRFYKGILQYRYSIFSNIRHKTSCLHPE